MFLDADLLSIMSILFMCWQIAFAASVVETRTILCINLDLKAFWWRLRLKCFDVIFCLSQP